MSTAAADLLSRVDDTSDYLKRQNQVKHSILNPVLLTKELDAFYHIFINLFQKIENEITLNQV
jgi:CRISPR/Cas system-associated protein Csm6